MMFYYVFLLSLDGYRKDRKILTEQALLGGIFRQTNSQSGRQTEFNVLVIHFSHQCEYPAISVASEHEYNVD